MITTGAQALALVAGFGTFLFVLELVRRRQLREKYAVMWLMLAVGMGVMAFFPRMLDGLAGVLSITDPSNVLFVVAILLILGVVIHLSWELSRLEAETRTLSEDLALLRLEVDRNTRAGSAGGLHVADRPRPADVEPGQPQRATALPTRPIGTAGGATGSIGTVDGGQDQ